MRPDEFIKEIIPLTSKVFRLSNRLLNDPEKAKDMVQTIYLKLWDKRDDLVNMKNREAYIIKMTKNACLDKIRLSKNNVDIMHYERSADPGYDEAEFTSITKKIIRLLPELQRKIIEMRDIDGFSFEEISEILDLPLNNIRVSLSIARKKVREELIKTYNYGLR